jgi:hypothetical protein
VRDRELTERDQLPRALAEQVAVTIRAADREHHGRTAAVILFRTEDLVRERDRGDRRAALVERVQMHVLRQRREQRLLVLGLGHGERAERTQALPILVFRIDEVALLESSDDGEGQLHDRAES